MGINGRYGVNAPSSPQNWVTSDFAESTTGTIVEGAGEQVLLSISTVNTRPGTFLILTAMVNCIADTNIASNVNFRLLVDGNEVCTSTLGGSLGNLFNAEGLAMQVKLPSPSPGVLVINLVWEFIATAPGSALAALRASLTVEEVRT